MKQMEQKDRIDKQSGSCGGSGSCTTSSSDQGSHGGAVTSHIHPAH